MVCGPTTPGQFDNRATGGGIVNTLDTMVEKNPTNKELAAKLSRHSAHSRKEIRRVLAAFIDPNNPNMSLAGFLEELTKMAVVGRGKHDRRVVKELKRVLSDVRDSRLFNARYIGHMLTESSIPGLLGYMLAMRIGSNTVAREVSKTESELEPEAMRGLLEMVGFNPDQGSGTFTSGGSMANMTALLIARKLTEEKIAKESGTRSIGNSNGGEKEKPQKMLVLCSPFAHYSINKVCSVIGGPGKLVEQVQVASKGLRMSTEDLRLQIAKAKQEGVPVMAILAIAGETETGLVDPLEEIANIAEENGINLIVDGAYGAPYRISRAGRKFKGMERAMAISIDPHKALYTPYSNGAVLFRNAQDHALLNVGVEAPYLGFPTTYEGLLENIQENKGSLGEKRIEGSMGAGPILSVIAVLRTLGRKGLATLYDLTLDRTEHLYKKIEESKYFDAVHKPDLNLLCFTLSSDVRRKLKITTDEAWLRFITDSRTKLDKNIIGKGGYFFSETVLPTDIKDKTMPVYRACILHPRTTNKIIDNAVNALETIIEKEVRERE